MHVLRAGAVMFALASVSAWGEEWHPLPKTLPKLTECQRAEREGGQAARTFSEKSIYTLAHCITYRRIEAHFSDRAYAPGDRPRYSGGEYAIVMLRYRVMPRSLYYRDGSPMCTWKPEKLFWRITYADGKPLTRQFTLVRSRSTRALWLKHRWQWRELPRDSPLFAGETKGMQEILKEIIP